VLLLTLAGTSPRPAPAQGVRSEAELAALQKKAAAALKPLQERFAQPAADKVKLVQDLVELRGTYAATPQAVQAAGLLAQLPSPLDRLDANRIAALERFDWQPKELVAVLGEHLGRHGSAVSCVAFSPDGLKAASGGSSYLRLWNPATMRLYQLTGQSYGITSIAFSRDSKTLAAGDSGGYVGIWDVTEANQLKLRYHFNAASGPVYSVSFHPSNKYLAAGCFDNHLRIYDVSGPKHLEHFTMLVHEKALMAVAYSADGKGLATGCADNSIKLWAVNAMGIPQEKAVLQGHTGPISAVAFNPASTLLASASQDGTIRLWSATATGKPRERTLLQPLKPGAIHCLSFSSSGQTLAIGCADNSVRLWALNTTPPRERAHLEGHAGAVHGVAYSPDNKLLLTGAQDWTVRTWDMTSPKLAERFMPWSHLSHVYSVAFAPDGQTLASGSEDRVLRLWDLTRSEPRTRSFLKGDSIQLYVVAYSPDGKAVAAAGAGTTVRQWDAGTGKVLRPCTGLPAAVYFLHYSPDSKQLLIGDTKSFALHDAATGAGLRRFDEHPSRLNCLALAPDGRRAISGSGYYEYKDGQIVVKDAKVVYTDCLLRLWDLDSGKELQALNSSTVPIYSCGFVADGKEVYWGPYEAGLRKAALAGNGLTENGTLKGAHYYAYSMAFAPDGQTMATHGLDGKVIVWELATGKRLKEWVFPERTGALAFAPDSRHLAVSLGTGVVYVLRLK